MEIRRILVVDAHEPTRQFMELAFPASEGWELLATGDFEEANIAMEQCLPDFAILDDWTAKRQKASAVVEIIAKEVPTAITFDFLGSFDPIKARETGAKIALEKPWNLSVLKSAAGGAEVERFLVRSL